MTSEAQAKFVNSKEFSRLLSKNTLVVVNYTVNWYGPCSVVTSSIEKLAEEYGKIVKIVKIDVDENPDIVKKYGICSIPAVSVFRDRKVRESLFGIQPYEIYRNILETQLKL